MKKLTKAQRRVLAGCYRSQQEVLASEFWGYVPNYGEHGRSYYGIVGKLIRRGYMTKHQTVQLTRTHWVSMNLISDKGRKALQGQP